MTQPQGTSMPGWARALFIIFGLIVLGLSSAMFARPWVTLEFIMILIPIALLFNGISLIVMGLTGRK